MFVRELDRPWLEVPFKFQGFYIRSVGDVEALKEYCDHVFIDLNKSRHLGNKTPRTSTNKIKKESTRQREQTWLADSHLLKSTDYEDVISLEDELIPAMEARLNAATVVEGLYADIRSGSCIDSTATRLAIIVLVDSIIRNPDAHTLIALLEERDKQRVIHSVNVCTLSLAFGRQYGFHRQQLIELGLGALLHDIGQAKVPLDIVTKEGPLSDEEYALMKIHSTHGMELLLEENHRLPYRSVDIVYSHHERYDGRGYPQRLVGDAIPLYGRMVAITDFYDAITSEYANREMLTAGTAMTELYARRDAEFDGKLVEEFIKCIGIFPVGSTVLLNSGEVGIVITQNRRSRLEPKLMLVLDKEEKFYPAPKLLDMALFKNEEDIKIVRIVAPADYGINVKYYLSTMMDTLNNTENNVP